MGAIEVLLAPRTRNAIAGKLHRLGLSDDDRAGAQAEAVAKRRKKHHREMRSARRASA